MQWLLLLLPIFTILGLLDLVTGFDIEDRIARKASERAFHRRQKERQYQRLCRLQEEENKLIKGKPSIFDSYKEFIGVNPYRVARECVEHAQQELEG